MPKECTAVLKSSKICIVEAVEAAECEKECNNIFMKDIIKKE